MCTCPVPCPDGKGSVIYRPCGKCLECLQLYQQDWTSRLSEEFNAWQSDSIIFFTLTYGQDELPVRVTVDHSSIRLVYDSMLQIDCRYKDLPKMKSFLSDKLGIDSFEFTRPFQETNKEFLSDRKCLCDSWLDMPIDERPAIIVPTVNYDDVNTWIRYCRKYHDRHEASVKWKDRRVSRYLKDLEFVNVHGVLSDYPDSAYTPSFKYFITSEYGPRTLRPHYHGVLMGVSEEEFMTVFLPYWKEHYGCNSSRSVKYSVYDPSKGGALYICKYCSKGSFEHPLCTKVVHDRHGVCHPFGHYVKCKSWFDSDDPLCTPTFHLISKGIGIRYPFKADIQKYWHVQCDEFTNFITKDESQLGDKYIPIPLDFKLKHENGQTNHIYFPDPLKCETALEVVEDSYKLVKSDSASIQNKSSRILGESWLYVDPNYKLDDFLVFVNSKYNKKYVRTFYYKDRQQVYSSLLPRYYRRFLLSPFSSSALSYYYGMLHEYDFSTERRQYQSLRSEDAKASFLRQKSYSAGVEQSLSAESLSRRFNRFYDKPFAGDIE